MTWYVKSFEDLTTKELYDILKERTAIFVVEQECPYLEIDGKDEASYHLFKKEKGQIVAYARLLPKGVSYTEASFGRVLVHKRYRGTGLGRELVERGLTFLEQEMGEQVVKIQAQSRLQQFYALFGFEAISAIYEEDGIPHIDMIKSFLT
ncbi:GNAT family N-acetyltransferase [Priestia megaterium]|nr:GNAT family N-acetyltransferase [Priestia megaterium]